MVRLLVLVLTMTAAASAASATEARRWVADTAEELRGAAGTGWR